MLSLTRRATFFLHLGLFDLLERVDLWIAMGERGDGVGRIGWIETGIANVFRSAIGGVRR
jgi:hypothetical protein